MSDLNPRDLNPGGYDRYGNAKFDPPDPDGKGPYVLLAILVLIGLVGGLLYFNGTPKDNNNLAAAPDRATTAPARPGPAATPAPATPSATPATPNTGMTAPATPPATEKQ